MKLIALSLLFLTGCGKAVAGGGEAVLFQATDGAQCYVVLYNGNPVGGNCK